MIAGFIKRPYWDGFLEYSCYESPEYGADSRGTATLNALDAMVQQRRCGSKYLNGIGTLQCFT